MGQKLGITTLVAVVTLVSQPVSAFAWSECGHHVVGILAFQQIDRVTQSRVISLLRQHPRFEEDFVVPQGVMMQDLDHWYVGRAGYWPDVARRHPQFNRPTWHYQLGASLVLGPGVTPPEDPGPLPATATLDTRDLHIAQAVELCRRTLRSPQSTDQEKALALCWLIHLVGDAHQPCHAGSCYVADLFPEGDRGANSIPTKQKGNLHGLWDGLLGSRYSRSGINRRVGEITGLKPPGMSTTNELSPNVWLEESTALAREFVYTEDVRLAVEATVRSGSDRLETIDLTEQYLKDAGRIAQERVKVAAARLAMILAQDL